MSPCLPRYCITENSCFNSLFNSCKVTIQYEHLSTVWISINATALLYSFHCSTTYEIEACVICDNYFNALNGNDTSHYQSSWYLLK